MRWQGHPSPHAATYPPQVKLDASETPGQGGLKITLTLARSVGMSFQQSAPREG